MFKTANIGATAYGFVDIEEGDEETLESAVARMGPASIAIDANHESFHFYSEGVYTLISFPSSSSPAPSAHILILSLSL